MRRGAATRGDRRWHGYRGRRGPPMRACMRTCELDCMTPCTCGWVDRRLHGIECCMDAMASAVYKRWGLCAYIHVLVNE